MRLLRLAGRLTRAEEGVAAVEMSLVGAIFCIALLNVSEIARYGFDSMQATAATQAGAEAALAACDVAHVPATTNCAGLNTAVATALQSTSLGTQVALKDPLSEAYYCLDNTGALTFVGSAAGQPPADCSAVNNAAGVPALYLVVSTSFTYAPMFRGLTVVGRLPQTMTHTAWMRMK
jgi:Flp pilus assembly protein TadG